MNYAEKQAFAAEVAKALQAVGTVTKVKARFDRPEDQMFVVQLANSAATIARALALGIDPDELVLTPNERVVNQQENEATIAVVRAIQSLKQTSS